MTTLTKLYFRGPINMRMKLHRNSAPSGKLVARLAPSDGDVAGYYGLHRSFAFPNGII